MTMIRLVPMSQDQYESYRELAEEGYAQHIEESGELARDDARRKAADDYARVIPDGLQTPDSYLFRAYDGDDEVGTLWYAFRAAADGKRAWIYDIVVDEGLRGRGYGRAILRAGEEFCRANGVTSIGLNVFGHNRVARALYEQEGFFETAVNMRKRL